MEELDRNQYDQGDEQPESLKFYNIFSEDKKTMESEEEQRIKSPSFIRPTSKIQVICKIMVSRKGSSVSYLKMNVGKDVSITKLIIALRTKIAVNPNESIFLLMNDKVIPKSDMTIGELAKDRLNKDGCLHTQLK